MNSDYKVGGGYLKTRMPEYLSFAVELADLLFLLQRMDMI